MTDETTVTNWRTRGAKAWAWAMAHLEIVIPAITFIIGIIVGKVL